jgi:hypothetical protein
VEVQAGSILDVRRVAGGFVVPANQILKGAGTILGSLTVEGVLAPDFSSRGDILTISNQLVLAGTTLIQITKFGPQSTGGSLRVAGALQLGGSLSVSNSSASNPIVFGDNFKLFNATNLTGEFASMQLPALANGLRWDVSRLPVDGTLKVAATPPQLAMIGSSRTAMTIRFQTVAGANYVLESTATLAPASNWTNVSTFAGNGGIRMLTIPISSATPQRFLRLRMY